MDRRHVSGAALRRRRQAGQRSGCRPPLPVAAELRSESPPTARTRDQLWRELVDTIDHGREPRLATPWFLEAGRGVRLSRPRRLAIWKLVEAQDLHATHWLMLRALVAEGPDDLFIAEGSRQRSYGRPGGRGRLGIEIVGRSRRLTLDYRTTAQNLDSAVGVLSGADFQDLEEGREFAVEQYRSARTGPRPILRQCDSAAEELRVMADLIKGRLAEPGVEPSTIAVLT